MGGVYRLPCTLTSHDIMVVSAMEGTSVTAKLGQLLSIIASMTSLRLCSLLLCSLPLTGTYSRLIDWGPKLPTSAHRPRCQFGGVSRRALARYRCVIIEPNPAHYELAPALIQATNRSSNGGTYFHFTLFALAFPTRDHWRYRSYNEQNSYVSLKDAP